METLTWWSQNILILAIPLFFATLVLEWFVLRHAALRGKVGYEWRDTGTSLLLGVIKLVVMSLTAGYTALAFASVYDHRLLTIDPLAWWGWPLLLILQDLCYYVYHRAAHRVRLLWCEHVNHHSSQHYNLSTALRQSTLGPVYGFVFYLPLAWVGFHPIAIALGFGINLLYQYWIHTEAIERMPRWFEAAFNTPSHHRVHHGSNPRYIDRNYAGILIIWDKMFGTFEPESADEPVVYGLTKNIHSFNPLVVIFHALRDLGIAVLHTPGLGNKVLRLIMPPDWEPASQQTSKDAHQAA